MSEVKRVGRYPDEMRERAVRMLLECRHEHPSQWKAIESVSEKLNINGETLRLWVRRANAAGGKQSAPTSAHVDELKRLRRENAELRRANDILKMASTFLGAELDRLST